MTERPRIVFMGTPDFAVPSLESCTQLGDVVLVVTQPDKPKGRGRELAAPPVKQWALARGLEVKQPEKLKTARFHEALIPLAPEVVVVAAYGKLLPPELLAVPKRGCVNVHGSLLPRWRGAAPIQRAVAAGDAITGVCLMLMEAGLDTGPVFARRELPIEPSDTGASMHDKLARLGAQALLEELPAHLAGQRPAMQQEHALATYAPPLRKEEGALDFSQPARVLEARLRGFTPWPGAYTHLEGKILKVLAVELRAGQGAPGELLAADASGIEIACGEGSLAILELLPEGKRAMNAAQFLAGRPLKKGTRL